MESGEKLDQLRREINERLRVQRGGADAIPYIDVGGVLADIGTRQNHVIFGRRGCGKTLLLHQSAKKASGAIKCVYLNCEDFKQHSFPNVFIQILDELFTELGKDFTSGFLRNRSTRKQIKSIRRKLTNLKAKADQQNQEIRESESHQNNKGSFFKAKGSTPVLSTEAGRKNSQESIVKTERSYNALDEKFHDLDVWIPDLKHQLCGFIDLMEDTKTIFLQIDDFYHLKRQDQPLVMDYIHRLCKGLPLYFKLATLRHASTLYADRQGQPIGAQERHDYQPINIEFTLANLSRTRNQNKEIFYEFGRIAEMNPSDIDSLFKGEGFDRLILAGGGVPRDCLSLFLEVLKSARIRVGDKRIGKDDVRNLSRSNLERRIEELKQDSKAIEQDTLIQCIYIFREFCNKSQTNVFMISEQTMQQDDSGRDLINHLLDYRIIHNCGNALTHKSQPGTSYQAFAIDIGCYAHRRVLRGRLIEIDLFHNEAKEKMRSAPIFDIHELTNSSIDIPEDVEEDLLKEE